MSDSLRESQSQPGFGVGLTLRDRIAAALDKALPGSAADVGFYQRLGVTPFVDIEAYDLNLESLADAVIAALALREDKVGSLTRYVTEWTGR